MAVDRTPASLDLKLGDDDDSATLGDLQAAPAPAPEEQVHETIVHERVHEALKRLPEPERKVIELRFGTTGEPRTRAQVQRELRIGAREAERLEATALGKSVRDGRPGRPRRRGRLAPRPQYRRWRARPGPRARAGDAR